MENEEGAGAGAKLGIGLRGKLPSYPQNLQHLHLGPLNSHFSTYNPKVSTEQHNINLLKNRKMGQGLVLAHMSELEKYNRWIFDCGTTDTMTYD